MTKRAKKKLGPLDLNLPMWIRAIQRRAHRTRDAVLDNLGHEVVDAYIDMHVLARGIHPDDKKLLDDAWDLLMTVRRGEVTRGAALRRVARVQRLLERIDERCEARLPKCPACGQTIDTATNDERPKRVVFVLDPDNPKHAKTCAALLDTRQISRDETAKILRDMGVKGVRVALADEGACC